MNIKKIPGGEVKKKRSVHNESFYRLRKDHFVVRNVSTKNGAF